MNDNGFAVKSALSDRRGKRRFKEFVWCDVGKLVLQSPTAGEWIRIESARQRATMAGMNGKKKEQEAANQDYMLLVCLLLVLDGERNPFFVPEDKELILGLDPALTDPLLAAAIEFAGLDEINAGDSQKNLSTTNGSSSPTG